MPVPDPRAGQAFIWIISCFLFICIAIGGILLIAYLLHPGSPAWLPYVGVFLVCLPWMFWFVTFLYRLVSRAFGFRMVLGWNSGGVGGSRGGGGGANADTTGPVTSDEPETAEFPEVTPRRVQFGEPVVLGENNDASHEGKNRKRSNSSSSSSSIASHESEMPLTISMAP